MSKKRILMKYYKQRLYRGRTALARAVDFVALRLILLAAGYLWFTTKVDSSLMAGVLALTTVTTLSVGAELYKSIRLERFILKERKSLAEKLFREKLVLLTRQEFLELVRSYLTVHGEEFAGDSVVYLSQTVAPVGEDAVLTACRAAKKRGVGAVALFSASPVSEAARTLAGRMEQAVRFIAPEQLTAHGSANDMLPDESAIDAAILAQQEKIRRQRKKSISEPFAQSRLRRYGIVAIALFALSFFVPYTLYYRVLAGACLSLGALTWWLNQTGRGENGQAPEGV